MKRLILQFLFCVLTFSVGVAVQRILAIKHHLGPAPKVQAIEPVSLLKVETPPPISPPPPTPNLILDYDPLKFYPGGSYQLIGKPPKGLREFNSLELALGEIDGRPSGAIVVFANLEMEFENESLVFGLVTPRHLYFLTSPSVKEGFQYRFDGEFIGGNMTSDVPEGKTVIKGTLTKLKDGQKIAEALVKFGVIHDHC
jgi:hypothetical protein